MAKQQIRSVESGNGETLVLGGKTPVSFPSIIAPMHANTLGMEGEMNVEWFEYNGVRYIVGADVLKGARDQFNQHLGGNRYGDDVQIALIMRGLAMSGIRNGSVDIVVYAPPGMYWHARHKYKRVLEGKNEETGETWDMGQHTVLLKGDKRPRKFRIGRVVVLPESFAIGNLFALDARGRVAKDQSAMDGRVLILDIGYLTADGATITDGEFDLANLLSATNDTLGIQRNVLSAIHEALRSDDARFASLLPEDIDRVIRHGMTFDDWTLRHAGLETSIKEDVIACTKPWAVRVANLMIDSIMTSRSGYRGFYVIGGGAHLIGETLRDMYEGAAAPFLDYRAFAHTKDVDPLHVNAEAGLRFMKNMQLEGLL